MDVPPGSWWPLCHSPQLLGLNERLLQELEVAPAPRTWQGFGTSSITQAIFAVTVLLVIVGLNLLLCSHDLVTSDSIRFMILVSSVYQSSHVSDLPSESKAGRNRGSF